MDKQPKYEIKLHVSQEEVLTLALFYGYRCSDKVDKYHPILEPEAIRISANLMLLYNLLTKEQKELYQADLKKYIDKVGNNVDDALKQLKTFNEAFKKFNDNR